MISSNPTLWAPHAASLLPSQPSLGEPSPDALLWLLVFGGVPPLVAPYEGEIRTDEMLRSTAAALEAFDVARRSAADIREDATRLLDEELLRATSGRKPLVLFSGGVDSSLMAARLVELGIHDITLLHYQFREGDAETMAARQVAQLLGLELTVVQGRVGFEGDCLVAPGVVYPVPFGDQSASPTAELCAAVARLADPAEVVVLDGTGADGAFGLGMRATQAHQRSPLIRVGLPVASSAYAGVLWRTNGRAEHIGRVLRRVESLKPVAASIAQNALFGILYEAGNLTRQISQWEATMDSLGVRDGVGQTVLSDLAITCARVFAQKTYGPLSSAGFDVAYPFLADSLVTLGVRHTASHPQMQPKAWMKEQLARHIDAALVHRTKSGFIDPERSLFDTATFQEALQEALAPESVFAALLRTKRLRHWLNRQDSLSRVPVGHQNLLWTMAFVNRWYGTRDVAHRRRP